MLCDNPFHYETICTQWRNWTLSFGFGDQLAAVAYHAIVIRAGFEPELIAPKTIVLPLHHRTIWADERNRTSVSYLEGRSNEPLYDICKTKKPLTFQSEVSQYYSKIITFYPTSVSSNCTKLPIQIWFGWLQSVCVRVLIVNIYLILLFNVKK